MLVTCQSPLAAVEACRRGLSPRLCAPSSRFLLFVALRIRLRFELQETSRMRDACACVGSPLTMPEVRASCGSICAPVVPVHRCDLILVTERWHAASRLLQTSRLLATRLA